jgi:hypothetical protein
VALRERAGAERDGGAHALRHRADLAEEVQDRAVALRDAREGKRQAIVVDRLARLGVLEHDVDDGVVEVILQERLGVAPLGDDAELRVVLEVGRAVRLEVLDAERGEPGGDAAGRHAREPLPELDALLAVRARRDLRTEHRRGVAEVHREVVRDVALARCAQRSLGSAVGEHRVLADGGQIRTQPEHHHSELPVAEVLLGRRDRDAALDVRLDQRDCAGLRLDVEQRDVREVPGVIVPARDQRRRRRAAAREQDVAAADGDAEELGARRRGRIVGAREQRGPLIVRLLEQHLLDRHPPAVEQPIHLRARRWITRVPRLRPLLHDAAHPRVHGDHRRHVRRARGDERRHLEELGLDLGEVRVPGRSRRDRERVDPRAERVERRDDLLVQRTAPRCTRLAEASLEPRPQLVPIPHERLPPRPLRRRRVALRDQEEKEKREGQEKDPSASAQTHRGE